MSGDILSQRMFVLSDPVENNNKFWEVTLSSQGCSCRWGRVGAKGQEKFYAGETERQVASRIREKTGKGYQEVAVLGTQSAQAADQHALARLASEQIAGTDSELQSLVRRLVVANRHEIVKATGGAITFNAEGFAQTALGLVQPDSIQQARAVLQVIATERSLERLDGSVALSAVGRYLQLVPQKVGSKRGWHTAVFGTAELIAQQYELLDKLEQSIEQASKDIAKQAKSARPADERVFEVLLEKVVNARELAKLQTLFERSVNRAHLSANLKLKAAYRLTIPSMAEAFAKDGARVGGVRELWHGTRTFNVLSILKSGLVVPKASAGHVNGRMFGDGLYFSDQATKALNYSFGYWDRSGGGLDSNCFMFLSDVAMGRAHTPVGGRVTQAPRGYDSVFAKAGVSGVMNNEMIVYRTGQANLKYLLEFEK